MKAMTLLVTLGLMGWITPSPAADTVASLLAGYRAAGADTFSAARGKTLYHQVFPGEEPQETRRCTTCHTPDPQQPGQHPKTGKTIAPLSPAAEPTRLQDAAHVEKWFQRNCTWTMGRACTPQEKGDFLTFLIHPGNQRSPK